MSMATKKSKEYEFDATVVFGNGTSKESGWFVEAKSDGAAYAKAYLLLCEWYPHAVEYKIECKPTGN